MWFKKHVGWFIILFLGVFDASGTKAQDWTSVHSFYKYVKAAAAISDFGTYFLNPNYGFVFTIGEGPQYPSIVTDTITMYRTTDAGVTWVQMNMGSELRNRWGLITSMCFVSPSRGYITAAPITSVTVFPGQTSIEDRHIGGASLLDTGAGIYETLDSGNTWSRIGGGDSIYGELYAAQGILFCSNGFTKDDGKTWTPISFFSSNIGQYKSEIIAGNRDSLLSDVVNSSLDLGQSWFTIQKTDDPHTNGPVGYGSTSFSLCVIPHTLDVIACNPDMLNDTAGVNVRSTIQVSTDGGYTFNTTWRRVVPGIADNINWAASDGCSVYVQSGYQGGTAPPGNIGMIRSTDFGQTWVNIGGPDNYEDYPTISVTGHGAVVYALDQQNTLWKTTDGGDGALSAIAQTIVTTGHTLGIGASGNDTLITKLCDTASLSLWLHFMADNCDYGGLSAVTIDGLDSTTAGYSITSTHHPWSANQPDTAWVTILPQTPGTYPLTVHAHYTDDDFLQGDTTFNLTLVIKPNPGTLDLNAKLFYDFGTQALCAPVTVRDTFSIAAHGCEQVRVDSIIFRVDSSQFIDFTFKNSGSFIPDSAPRSFPISFKPSIADSERGKLFIYWFDGITPHVDTIAFSGAGVSDTRTFAIHADTLSIRMCDSAIGTISITNTTCGTLTLDSLALPEGVTYGQGMNPSFPLTLLPGESDSLTVHLSLGQPGTSELHVGDTALEAIASMDFIEHGSSSPFDTTIMLAIRVGSGIPAATLSTTLLDFGAVSKCGGAITLPVILSSTGCDTLNSSTAFPAAPFTLSKSFSTQLPVGFSDTTFVTFSPKQTGTFADTIMLTTNAGVDRIALKGIGFGGTKILAADTSLRDLGGLYACQSRDSTIVLSNPGCDTLRIDSARLTNGAYRTGGTYPVTIPPDSSIIIPLHLSADSAGMNGTLTFFSDANVGDSAVTIPLTANIIPPAHLLLALSPSDTATDGTLATCYVLLEGQVPSGAISGMQFDITHNDDLLSFVNASGVTMTGTAGTPEAQVLHFAVGSQAGSLTYADTIGTITFRVYLSDSIFTPLSLSNVTFTNSLSLTDDCVASILDSGASFTYLYRCGEPIIQDEMENVTPFSIESIVPNPAGDEITIELSGDAQPVIEMYDALGRSVLTTPRIVGDASPPIPRIVGDASFIGGGVTLDVSSVPSGIYFLRVSSGGFVESRSVVVQH